MKRVTISMPDQVYQDIISLAPQGNVSKFIVDSSVAKIQEEKQKPKDPFQALLEVRKRVKHKMTVDEIVEAKNYGRS